jgi:calcineurin-like phosphoesterase family protein
MTGGALPDPADLADPADPAQARSPVRVLAVSDEVNEALAADPAPARGADLILACGDLPLAYLGVLMNALDVPLVFVPGNHDPDLSGYRSSRAGLTLRAGMPAQPPWPDGAVNADGRVVDAAGLRVAGLGGCLRYRDGANQYTDRQQARRAAALRAAARWRRLRDGRGVDVLLTHAPPRGVGDGDDPPHRGFAALHGLVAALRPAALLHGHVHPCGAQTRPGHLGDTMVCNVTGWHLLDIGPGTGTASLLSGARDRGRGDAL